MLLTKVNKSVHKCNEKDKSLRLVTSGCLFVYSCVYVCVASKQIVCICVCGKVQKLEEEQGSEYAQSAVFPSFFYLSRLRLLKKDEEL